MTCDYFLLGLISAPKNREVFLCAGLPVYEMVAPKSAEASSSCSANTDTSEPIEELTVIFWLCNFDAFTWLPIFDFISTVLANSPTPYHNQPLVMLA